MNRNSLTTAVIAGIAGVAGLVSNQAGAVNLNPDGLGQVLLYPYYTVNGGQGTLLSVVNTAAVGKAVKVRFLEGYNSREVLDFNLFLSPFDVWTADVFALSDLASGLGTGAGILTHDNSCTAPVLKESTSGTTNYVAFRTFTFSGDNSDTGPTDASRTREGHFEMITMADIVTGSPLYVDTKHVNGVPPGCGTFADGALTKAEKDFEADSAYVAPTSGLFGSAEVVQTANGTYYTYNADALDGFTAVPLEQPTSSLTPSLAQVNPATSYVFDDGVLLTSSWTSSSEAIDAVSSVFMASNIYNEYEANGVNGTDWVVTFPTKRFYVDTTLTLTTQAIAPFEETFGEHSKGLSCTVIGIVNYDREENTLQATGCGFSPCPPGQPPSSICHETNVITFNANSTTSSVLDSTLTSNIVPIGSAGWAALNLDPNPGTSTSFYGSVKGPHNLHVADNGNQFHGLPITGFQATNFVVGGTSSILANYSGVNRHRISRSCTNAAGGCS